MVLQGSGISLERVSLHVVGTNSAIVLQTRSRGPSAVLLHRMNSAWCGGYWSVHL